MGEHTQNPKAMMKQGKPARSRYPMRAVMIARLTLKPGKAIAAKSEHYRFEDGKHQFREEGGLWMTVEADEVWVIEEKGPVPEEWWCYGIFLGVEMQDTVAMGGKVKQLIADSGQMLGAIEVSTVRQMERQMEFGGGGLIET